MVSLRPSYGEAHHSTVSAPPASPRETPGSYRFCRSQVSIRLCRCTLARSLSMEWVRLA